MVIEQTRDNSTTLAFRGATCIGLGIVMGSVAAATARHLGLWPALLLGLVFGIISGIVLFLAARLFLVSHSLERVFFFGFIGFVLLGGTFWINRGISSYMTVVAFATAVVNLIGFVIRVRSRSRS